MTDVDVLLQQLLIGLSNGMIIALIALGYTMVYGIIELINFAHGDLFMLGAFFALTVVGVSLGNPAVAEHPALVLFLLFSLTPLFCGIINVLVERFAYRPLRAAPKLAPLVSALGISFIFINIGLFWGGVPMDVFGEGISAASPKDFPSLLSSENLLGSDSMIQLTLKEIIIFILTAILLSSLVFLVKKTRIGKAMRAVAQDQGAAQLMGISVDKVVSFTFFVGGALAGIASVMYAIYNNTVFFQMGFRVGVDAFSAAVLGGIGSLPGAVLGGLLIGFIRAMSDQYIASQWTNALVFAVLISVLLIRPRGILGTKTRDKV